jgi:glucose-1-phosphate thymidylyltransferase
MQKGNVRKGVILAAGYGRRLGSLTTTCPKVLLPLGNQESLITYPIRALAEAGIKEIAIVIGHLAEKVMHGLGDGSQFGVKLHYLVNSNYLSGNAISVREARGWAQGNPVVLSMGDHLIEEKIVRRLLSSETSGESLCVDYTPAQHHKIEEATKVAVNTTGYIKNIGKELDHWNALDTGVFLITDDFFKAVDEVVQSCGTDIETADVIRFLIDRGYCFDTCDVSGCFWIDVDTPKDLDLARSL